MAGAALTRDLNETSVHLLKSVAQHRSVMLLQDISTQMNPVLRIDAQNPDVVRPMMDAAERESIGDLRNPPLLAIGQDVSGVE